MITFGAKYWVILLPLLALVALGIAFLLYFRNLESKELGKTKTWALGILRFLSFFLISLLILSPLLKHIRKTVMPPVIITAWDNSTSVSSFADSAIVQNQYSLIREKLEKELGPKYKFVNYTFGEKANVGNRVTLGEKKSDYGEMIETVTNNHFNENIGALIIAGDGIYNHGKNPLNLTHLLNFPVYTVGFGDTTVIADARIENIRYNRTSFSGNKFPIEADIHINRMAGKPLKLTVYEGKTEKVSAMVIPSGDDYFTTQQFILESEKPGLIHYTLSIQVADNERNTKNNSTSFVIHVMDRKQRIVILSEGPHPDIGAIKNTLDLQLSYEVKLFTEEPYPTELSNINLLIINQLPTISHSVSPIIDIAEKNHIPILYLIGSKTFIQQFNIISRFATIKQLAAVGEEAQPYLNRGFASFNISPELQMLISRVPPLLVPFADFTIEPEITTLFYQRIKNIETTKPLIALGMANGRKTGFIFGEGLWRWRVNNYYYNQSHNEFNELINQIVQYLSLKENDENFIISHKPVIPENENIQLNAELYNDNYERIKNADINIIIKNQANEEFKYAFDAQENGYQLNAGNLPVGDYSYEVSVKIGEKNRIKKGNFTVVQVNLEDINTRANHRMLYQLSSSSGGGFFMPDETEKLIEKLKTNTAIKPVNYFSELINPMLNMKWIFFVVLMLLSVEWFLRKFWGIY